MPKTQAKAKAKAKSAAKAKSKAKAKAKSSTGLGGLPDDGGEDHVEAIGDGHESQECEEDVDLDGEELSENGEEEERAEDIAMPKSKAKSKAQSKAASKGKSKAKAAAKAQPKGEAKAKSKSKAKSKAAAKASASAGSEASEIVLATPAAAEVFVTSQPLASRSCQYYGNAACDGERHCRRTVVGGRHSRHVAKVPCLGLSGGTAA
jgi:hypothetical protein